MEILGIAMLSGAVFGSAYSASKSGATETKLRKSISDVKQKTDQMEGNLKTLLSDLGTVDEGALQDAILYSNAIIEISQKTKLTSELYLEAEKKLTIYGIVIGTVVTLYLIAKLLLPSWKEIAKL